MEDNNIIKTSYSENIEIKNCHFETKSYSIYFWGSETKPCYNISVHDCTFNNNSVDVPNKSDGVHFNGYCDTLYLYNLSGFTGDDFIALNACEGEDTNGYIKNVFIHDCVTRYKGNNCFSSVRIYGTHENTFENINIIDCYFYSQQSAITISNASKVTYEPTNPNISIDKINIINCNIELEQCKPNYSILTSIAFFVSGSTIKNMKIDNIKVLFKNTGDVENKKLIVTNCCDIDVLNISNIFDFNGNSIIMLERVNATKPTTINKLFCRNIEFNGTSSDQLIRTINGGTCDNLFIEKCIINASTIFNIDTTSAIHNAYIDDNVVNCSYAVVNNNIIDFIKMSNNVLNLDNGCIYDKRTKSILTVLFNNNIVKKFVLSFRVNDNTDISDVRLNGDCITTLSIVKGIIGDSHYFVKENKIYSKKIYDGSEFKEIVL